jgi:hypothetical protein
MPSYEPSAAILGFHCADMDGVSDYLATAYRIKLAIMLAPMTAR